MASNDTYSVCLNKKKIVKITNILNSADLNCRNLRTQHPSHFFINMSLNQLKQKGKNKDRQDGN